MSALIMVKEVTNNSNVLPVFQFFILNEFAEFSKYIFTLMGLLSVYCWAKSLMWNKMYNTECAKYCSEGVNNSD